MNNGFFSLKGVFSLLARNYALMDPQGDRHRDLIELIIIFSHTLACDYFIFAYPAVRLFSLTLLCDYFIFAYSAVRLFYFCLPCCAIIFTYPAVRLFYFHLPRLIF